MFQMQNARKPYQSQGQRAPASFTPWQPNSGFRGMSDQSYGMGVQAQAQKDMAGFGALQNMGIAGQNAMANYGNSRNAALVNSQIAQANAQGQMAAQWLNTYGQGMNVLGGLNAAASQAGGDANKAAALGGLGSGMVNAGMYGSQMGPYTAGNMPNFNFGGFGGGGGGGFTASGPGGLLASGSTGPNPGYQPVDESGFGPPTRRGGRNFNSPPAPPYMQAGGNQGVNPYMPFQQSLPALQGMMRGLNDPNGFANLARQDVNRGFGMTQGNLMDNSILNSLNGQMAMGYDTLGKMYDKSDYGFNTGFGNVSTTYNPWSGSFRY